jgi:hypothetical protein
MEISWPPPHSDSLTNSQPLLLLLLLLLHVYSDQYINPGQLFN